MPTRGQPPSAGRRVRRRAGSTRRRSHPVPWRSREDVLKRRPAQLDAITATSEAIAWMRARVRAVSRKTCICRRAPHAAYARQARSQGSSAGSASSTRIVRGRIAAYLVHGGVEHLAPFGIIRCGRTGARPVHDVGREDDRLARWCCSSISSRSMRVRRDRARKTARPGSRARIVDRGGQEWTFCASPWTALRTSCNRRRRCRRARASS